MKVFERQPTRVLAFQVPVWGEAAADPVPDWLVHRMKTGEVRLNQSGGLSANYVWGTRGCAPGDYILLNDEEEVEFCTAERFAVLYKEVEAE